MRAVDVFGILAAIMITLLSHSSRLGRGLGGQQSALPGYLLP